MLGKLMLHEINYGNLTYFIFFVWVSNVCNLDKVEH